MSATPIYLNPLWQNWREKNEGVHKPDPRLFEITAERLGVKPQECIYVGDHPVNDIQGALSAGMGAIRMNFGWFKDKDLRPDVPVITDIIDVLKYVYLYYI